MVGCFSICVVLFVCLCLCGSLSLGILWLCVGGLFCFAFVFVPVFCRLFVSSVALLLCLFVLFCLLCVVCHVLVVVRVLAVCLFVLLCRNLSLLLSCSSDR